MAPPDSPMRSLRWLPRPGATTFSKPRPNASPSRIRATTLTGITGRTGAMPDAPGWACRWCHGAPGIGLARAALLKRARMDATLLQSRHPPCPRRCRSGLADGARHALLRNARQRGVSSAKPATRSTVPTSAQIAAEAARGGGAGRRFSRRLSLEQRQTAVQSRAVPRPCRRRLYAAAARSTTLSPTS